ncbi:MAG: TlyA family RNA methyltransferase [Hyphomicrobiales bacterium]|nr:TlyA family RNA methyltransferase [Hyphomicrobiales bacterium]
MQRKRADIVLVERGFFPSRAKAREAIEAGLVLVDGAVLRKPAELVAADADIAAEKPYPWVSRGGVKLAAALDAFRIDPAGQVCVDIGASTGGFCHVLLERGAGWVYGVDVGQGQLDPRLAGREGLVSMEQCDARTLTAERFLAPPHLAVFDVSFISLKLVFPAVLPLLAEDAAIVALIKPQFEAGREHVAKGVVRDPAMHEAVCADIRAFLEAAGWRVAGLMPSPIEGGDGNREFLIAAMRGVPAFVQAV